MQVLLILNDPPYGAERCYNGLRLALALAKSDPAIAVTVFLMADAVLAAKSGQKTPDGYYNVERMLRGVLAGKGQILLCGSCMDARGLADAEMLNGVRRSTMAELATITASARESVGVLIRSDWQAVRDTRQRLDGRAENRSPRPVDERSHLLRRKLAVFIAVHCLENSFVGCLKLLQ